MLRPGSIRKVEVRNFVTYSQVEMYPGPNLNMIIGPNGTGKSTIVAAIILGLGGNPKTVGRGTKISEYVKHNCDGASIHISLQSTVEDKYIKVTREFDTHDKTVWKLDNKIVKLDDILKCINNFNIQVNNICQFLPQDRVQDFAKLNKQELLMETMKALCRYDLIEKQEALVKCKDTYQDLQTLIDNSRQKLQEAQDANYRLEGRVQSFNKKKDYDEIINNIDRKIAWMHYENAKGEVDVVKKDRRKAQEVFNKYKHAIKPMEDKCNIVKKQVTELQQSNSKLYQVVKNCELSINANLGKVETLKDSITKLEDDMNLKLVEIEQCDKEIHNATAKLAEIRKQQAECHAKCASSNQEKQRLLSEMTKIQGLQTMVQNRKDETMQLKQDEVIRIRLLEHQLLRLEDVKKNRLQHLERIDQDAATAVKWLRNNKDLFEDDIFEPIMLEINVLDSNKAKYVENVIPIRDRLAFTCVNKNDMNKLISCLREKQNLSVNVIHSSRDSQSQCQPNVPIEHLRKFGFYTYIYNLFTAPEPIMRYLCRTYNIHNIPVGDSTTDDRYEQLPQQIRFFFSEQFRYNISTSKYSGEKSVTQDEVRGSDGGLAYSLDVIKVNKLKGEINEINKKVQNLDAQYKTSETQLQTVNEKINALKDKLREIQQEKQHAVQIDSKVQKIQNSINEMQKLKKCPNEIRAETKKRRRNIILNMSTVQEAIKNEYGKLCKTISSSNFNVTKIEYMRTKIAYIENEMGECRQRCEEAEDQLNRIIDKYNELKNEAKTILTKARNLSNGLTPADDEFNVFREAYDNLPTNIEELTSRKEQYLSRIDCLNIADNTEIKEYEARIVEIGTLQDKLEKANSDLNKVTTRMGRMQTDWLNPLRQLIAEINTKFAMSFERMGCTGEISLYTQENEDDFSRYGICIRVSYRAGEPVQELNSNIQSGGERAVATAAYMLSLQELTPVPFRCVDEINQGMDADNERRIFELIVESTCHQNSSQYFLVTPKLVPHLKYSPNLAVHIVHNGPFVKPDRKWSFSDLCNPQNLRI